MINKEKSINIPCTECGCKKLLSIREIESNPDYTCAGCGKQIHIDATSFMDKLTELENQLKNINMNLKIKI